MVLEGSPVILGSSAVPYSPFSPSPSALLRSSDGQLAAVARGGIHILTPSLGYNAAITSIQHAGAVTSHAGTKGGADAVASVKGKGREREMPLLRTTIPVDRKNVVKWADWADEYDLALPAGVEPGWRSASWSPSGLSGLGGCILATLTSNAEVLLFEPRKKAIQGEWFEIADLTALLVEEIVTDYSGVEVATRTVRRELVAQLLRCQTSALAWSSAIPGTAQDLSLLALGHRSGELTLWRLDEKRQPSRVARIKLHEETNVVGVLAWSDWTTSLSQDGLQVATAHLAVSDADGRVFSVPVSQALPSLDAAAPTCKVGDAVLVASADARAATQLQWVPEEGKTLLAFAKLGEVHLAQSADAQVVQTWEVELDTVGQDEWIGATNWAPCSGLQHLPTRGILLVSLSSGSIHALRLPSDHSPQLLHVSDLSASYTSAARECFVSALERARQYKDRFRTEGNGSVTNREGPKVLGMVALGSGRDCMDIAWIFETTQPDTFTYRTPADTRTHFMLANLVGTDGPEETLKAVDQALAASKNVRTHAPLATLGLLLQALAAHVDDSDFIAALLSRLQPLPIPPGQPVASDLALEERLDKFLNDEDSLGRIRTQEIIARGLLAHRASLSPEQEHAALVAQIGLARQLVKEVLGRLTAALGAMPLSELERPYHARLLLASASLLPPESTDPAVALLPAEALAQAYEARDITCPACKAHVPMANVRYACCEQGHQWERCSLSLALIASVQVRTCSSCERKALLPSALGDLPEDGPVRRMLAAAKSCVMCGGRWMRVR